MAELLLLAFLSVVYGAFTFFAIKNGSFFSALIYILALLLVFPVIRIINKPKEGLGFFMFLLSFVLFFAAIILYPITSIPLPTMRDLSLMFRDMMIGL